MAFILAVLPEKPPWWDVAWATWALAVIGLAGTIAAIRTLRAIKRQVTEMQKAAELTEKMIAEATRQSIAAKRSADALISSERAWIVGAILGSNRLIYHYSLQLVNRGRTPSQVLRWTMRVDCLPLEMTSFEPEKLHSVLTKELHLFLEASGIHEEDQGFDIREQIDDWEAVKAGSKTGVIHFTIEYLDLVTGSHIPHETTFAYSFSVTKKTLRRLPQYNSYR